MGSCMRSLSSVALALRLAIAPAFAGEVYLVDSTRSEAKFEIRYLLSTLAGRVRDISGTINLDFANPTASSVKFVMKTGSVATGSAELDLALRSAAFLNVARFPQITFESTLIKSTPKANAYQVVGDLTLHGITKPVTLAVEFGGAIREQDGSARVAFSVRGTLNRKDYGISWNKGLDQGSVLVGDNVEITVNLQALQQAPTATSR